LLDKRYYALEQSVKTRDALKNHPTRSKSSNK